MCVMFDRISETREVCVRTESRAREVICFAKRKRHVAPINFNPIHSCRRRAAVIGPITALATKMQPMSQSKVAGQPVATAGVMG